MNPLDNSALGTALKIQRAAAAVGFDWPDAVGPREKISEELAELDQAAKQPGHSGAAPAPDSIRGGNPAKLEEELGDLLFAVVNYARHLDVEPERALVAANVKFQRRFRYIEERLDAEGLQPTDVDLVRLDELWNEAKRDEVIR